MNKLIELEILSPDQVLYAGKVTGVKLPGTSGSFEILNNHAPIVSKLEKGEIRINAPDGMHKIAIQGGVVEMLGNKITVLA